MQTASQLADDLAEKLKWFVDYYEQCGIGDCEEGNDDEDDGGEFDGDERFNVRHGRQALERYAAALTALSEQSGDGDASKRIAELERRNHMMMEADLTQFEYDRLVAWINDPNRQPANTAFTAGATRTACYAIENSGILDRLSDCDRRVRELEGSIEQFKDACEAAMMLPHAARMSEIGVGKKEYWDKLQDIAWDKLYAVLLPSRAALATEEKP